MRLINADYLCDYANNTVDKTVDANDIMRMPYIEAVPLKPLAEWLAGYATPPGGLKVKAHKVVNKPDADYHRLRAEAWEEFLRGMNWRAADK